MAKGLPKNLSSIRARSTSLSNSSQDWQNRTAMRSSSGIISALINNGPREKWTLDDQITTLIARIKREQKRIAKAKAFGTPPIGRETEESKNREAYIMKKEGICNRYFFLLQELNAQKQIMDARENKKFQNKTSQDFIGADEGFVKVGAHNSKRVPVKQTTLIHHRNAPGAFLDKIKTMAVEVKRVKQKKVYSPEIQKEIDKVFTPVSVDEFADLFGDDEE